jgi:hypothetical protein
VLSGELLDDPPAVVILTTRSPEVEARVPVWILLNEDGSSRCVVSIHGEWTEHTGLGLPALLDILDEVTR